MKYSRMLLVLGLSPVLAVGAFCQTYVPINAFAGGPALETFPTSINDQGVIAGYYTDALVNRQHGFVRVAEGCAVVVPICTPFTSFDVPQFLGTTVGTFVSSINDAGAITGYFVSFTSPASPGNPPPNNHGYVRDPEGNLTTFDPPSSISTIPRSINDGGIIAGYYNESNLRFHGFVREPNGTIIPIDPPGSISTQAVSINAKGTITGSYSDEHSIVHGFVRRPNGTFITFDPPESMRTVPTGINNAGAITGVYTANGRGFGFVRRADGKIVSFDVPGSLGTFALLRSVLTSGLSINDEGAITGSYSDNAGTHGFVRSPEGMITSFDPPSNGIGCPPNLTSATDTTLVTSINEEGVITGWCLTGAIVDFFAGFARYP